MAGMTPRRAATLARLTQAAVVEFARNGIDGTSIEMLCEAAGFTRGAFYSNFASKDELCLAMMRQMSEETIAAFEQGLQAMPHEMDPDDVIPTLLAGYKITHEDRQVQRELELRASRNPEFAAQMREVQLESWTIYKRFVEQALARAGYEPKIDIDDLMHLFQALYFYPDEREPTSPGRSVRLINLVAGRFTRKVS